MMDVYLIAIWDETRQRFVLRQTKDKDATEFYGIESAIDHYKLEVLHRGQGNVKLLKEVPMDVEINAKEA